jgi:hypothetical protein
MNGAKRATRFPRQQAATARSIALAANQALRIDIGQWRLSFWQEPRTAAADDIFWTSPGVYARRLGRKP